jgi:hypothetical protein
MGFGLLHQSYSSLCVAEYPRLEQIPHLPLPKLVLGSDDLLCLVVVPSLQLQVLQPPYTWDPFPLDHLVSNQPPRLDHCSACRRMYCAPNVISWLVVHLLYLGLQTSPHMSPVPIVIPLALTAKGLLEA